jgi:recombination protein RecT
MTKDAGYTYAVMDAKEVEAHRDKYSRAAISGPWVKDFDAMAFKTVLKKALKFAPLSSDVMRMVEADETIRPLDAGILQDVLDAPVEYVEYDEVAYMREVGDMPVPGTTGTKDPEYGHSLGTDVGPVGLRGADTLDDDEFVPFK